jgi:polyisoprenyl-teichoic acid--peptidoglycan teichoic acid transferase
MRRLIPRSRRGSLVRFAIGAVIVIAFSATTTAVAGLLQFKQFVADISITPAIKHARITIPHPGEPQTILIIGSDHRAGQPFKESNTDTMMLVHIDPKSSTINVVSVPRDLKVQIPEGGGLVTSKLNAAYSVGGPNLLVKVLKQQVFPGLAVNHIVDVNFGGFQALVDAIGCVYTDVDHRYYNNTQFTNYSSIDLQPGYQRLCGADALSFVRFRHTDSDLVRNARQQDFIRWAKDQYGIGQLVSHRDRLLKIFGKHTQTDSNLHTLDGLENLFNLVAFSAGHSIKQIPFPAVLAPCGGGGTTTTTNSYGQTITTTTAPVACYVTAEQSAEARAFKALMRPTVAAAHKASANNAKKRHRQPSSQSIADAKLTGDASDGRAQAAKLSPPGLPVYFPRVIGVGSKYCSDGTCTEGPVPNSYPRAYRIRARDGTRYPAYRMTLVVNPLLGQYYGVQGTTWLKAPILNGSNGARTINGKRLKEYFDGSKLTMVAWHTGHAVYWISNTLTSNLSNAQMLGIAASLTRFRQ